MANSGYPIATLVLAATAGAAISWGIFSALDDSAQQHEQIVSLERQLMDLELSLAEKDKALAKARAWSWDFAAADGESGSTSSAATQSSQVEMAAAAPQTGEPAAAVVDSQQILRDLSTLSDQDPRSFSDKVADLLAADSSPETIAIVSQGLVDMAQNTDVMPDYALTSLYQSQSNPEVKRVAAQVLSMRGDNSLMEKQISEAQAGLRSESPAERQKTLVALAKTRYAGAANAVAPLLRDADTGVKLDALLALKATGNQSHIHLVESLVNHPDPSVSWLAKDVMDSLQNLSDRARTRLASTDVVAELPVLSTQ